MTTPAAAQRAPGPKRPARPPRPGKGDPPVNPPGRHTGNQGVTPHSWARSLLIALGAPTTKANVDSVVSWEAQEGGNWRNTATFNPLNTTQVEPGSTSMNSVGVQAYDSWATGLRATITTLQNGDYNDVTGALKSGKGLFGRQFAGLSTWSGGGYDTIGNHVGYGGGSGTPIGNVQLTSADPATCAISLPSTQLFLFFGPEVGGQCLLSKSEVRAIAAVVMLAGGAIIALIGATTLLGYTKPAQTIAQVAIGVIPGGRAVRAAASATAEKTESEPAAEAPPAEAGQ